jgi:polyisoprenoid-binding protein YceI
MSTGAAGDGPRHSYGHATTSVLTLVFFGAMVGAATWARMTPVEVATVPAAVSPDAATAPGAAGEAPATAAAPAEAAPLWTVDIAASRVGFAFPFTGRPVEGTFARFEPTIRFSPDDLAGSSIEVVIDTASATTGPGISAPQLAGPDGFAADAFPTAVFRADAIRADGEGYAAEGTLTIREASVR